MGVTAVQPQLVEKRLLDNFVRQEKWLDPHPLQQPTERAGKMPVNKIRVPIGFLTSRSCFARNNTEGRG